MTNPPTTIEDILKDMKVNGTFKSFLDLMNNQTLPTFFKTMYPDAFKMGMTFDAIRGTGGEIGLSHSILSTCITNNFIDCVSGLYPHFKSKKGNSVDFEIVDPSDENITLQEGDFKVNFDLNTPNWTGNGCSSKRGKMVMIKIDFDFNIPVNSPSYVYFKNVMVMVIDSQHITNGRGGGKSDMSTIKIDRNLVRDNARFIYGLQDYERGRKWSYYHQEPY